MCYFAGPGSLPECCAPNAGSYNGVRLLCLLSRQAGNSLWPPLYCNCRPGCPPAGLQGFHHLVKTAPSQAAGLRARPEHPTQPSRSAASLRSACQGISLHQLLALDSQHPLNHSLCNGCMGPAEARQAPLPRLHVRPCLLLPVDMNLHCFCNDVPAPQQAAALALHHQAAQHSWRQHQRPCCIVTVLSSEELL